MADRQSFGSGIFYHDMYILAEMKNCLFNTDLQVLTELYILIKRSNNEELKNRFPRIIDLFEQTIIDPSEMSGYIQETKLNKNPILDFYNWDDMTPLGFKDPFAYADSVYDRLCYQENDTLGVDPQPTLLANVLRISLELPTFKALYIIDKSFSNSMKEFLVSFFKGNRKVELLEGTINEAVTEIPDINFVMMENVADLNQLLVDRNHIMEVLIPEYRDNMLYGDLDSSEGFAVLALPDEFRENREKYNLSVSSIRVPL